MSERAERVAALVQRELAELVRELHDPRVQAATLISITHVRVSDDLSVARVLVSVLGDDPPAVVRAIGHAAGFLHRQLGRRMRAKKIPELRFVLDDTAERAERVEQLLRDIHEK